MRVLIMHLCHAPYIIRLFDILCFAVDKFKYNKMSGLLEDNLTNSIRRAKEKIYNHSLGVGSVAKVREEENRKEMERGRTYSQKGTLGSESALAAAMRNLQERIAVLEQEKKELASRSQHSMSVQSEPSENQELISLTSTLNSK
jgi:hypothetical protein